jgi:hypothetical protein
VTDHDAIQDDRDKLITAIRRHRDEEGDDRCHLDDKELYFSLFDVTGDPEDEKKADVYSGLGPEAEFLESCKRYRRQRGNPNAKDLPGCMTMRQLQDALEEERRRFNALSRAIRAHRSASGDETPEDHSERDRRLYLAWLTVLDEVNAKGGF